MKTAQELDENIYFVHLTDILPPSGTMIPGSIIVPNSTDKITLKKHQDFLEYVPNRRMTIHWFANELLLPHESNISNGKYLIIERAKFIRPQLYGGYAEDYFTIGLYRLSSEAIIFVPEEEINGAKAELYGFKGTIIGYPKSKSLDLLATGIIIQLIQLKIFLIILKVSILALLALIPKMN